MIRGITLGFFYAVWVRASAVGLVLWAAFSRDSAWFAQAALTVILMLLFVSGILLLGLGARDLIRDFRHFLQARSHKDSHASV
jgi:membrane protein required for beta-lactamase induction